jgi:uncharacterized protein (DUF1330 family)
MPAYILVLPQEIWSPFSTDPTVVDPYSDQVEATLAPYGGSYLRLRNQPIEMLEGDWQPPLGMAIIAFPSAERARAWFNSPEYAPLRAFRRSHSRAHIILADGMPEGMTLRGRALAEAERARARLASRESL